VRGRSRNGHETLKTEVAGQVAGSSGFKGEKRMKDEEKGKGRRGEREFIYSGALGSTGGGPSQSKCLTCARQ